MNMIVKRYLQLLVLVLVQAVILFLSAGSLMWGAAWVYIAIYCLSLIGAGFIITPEHREVIEERSKGAAGGKAWDVWLTRFMVLPTLGQLIIAGLDWRYGWLPDVGLSLQITGAVLFVGGYCVVVWAMLTNKFFSGIVRIQTERNHHAVTDGPYRFVRHPGYASMIVSSLGAVWLLGSWWAMIAYGVYVLTVIVRTALEDRTLQAELPGYAEFAQKTRYRLIPGLW
jgi:protein-S-isoprenylcysteine O-methyltransferase Ste14